MVAPLTGIRVIEVANYIAEPYWARFCNAIGIGIPEWGEDPRFTSMSSGATPFRAGRLWSLSLRMEHSL